MRRLFLLAVPLAVLLTASSHAVADKTLPKVVVFFGSWSAKLDDAATRAIQNAADWAKQHPHGVLAVTGYASTIGSAKANEYLSLLRAQMVSDTLAADGVPAARIRNAARGAIPYVLDPEEARRVVIALDPP